MTSNYLKKMAIDLHNGTNYINCYVPVLYKIPDDKNNCSASEIKIFLEKINANTKTTTQTHYQDGIRAYIINRIMINSYNRNNLDEILNDNTQQ